MAAPTVPAWNGLPSATLPPCGATATRARSVEQALGSTVLTEAATRMAESGIRRSTRLHEIDCDRDTACGRITPSSAAGDHQQAEWWWQRGSSSTGVDMDAG